MLPSYRFLSSQLSPFGSASDSGSAMPPVRRLHRVLIMAVPLRGKTNARAR